MLSNLDPSAVVPDTNIVRDTERRGPIFLSLSLSRGNQPVHPGPSGSFLSGLTAATLFQALVAIAQTPLQLQPLPGTPLHETRTTRPFPSRTCTRALHCLWKKANATGPPTSLPELLGMAPPLPQGALPLLSTWQSCLLILGHVQMPPFPASLPGPLPKVSLLLCTSKTLSPVGTERTGSCLSVWSLLSGSYPQRELSKR